MADWVVHLAQPRTFDFLGVGKYQHVNRWADMIMERPATYRGMRVCAGGARLRLRPRVACSLTVCLNHGSAQTMARRQGPARVATRHCY